VPRISSRRTPAAFLFLLAAFVPAAFADGPYVIGSANTVTADPTIPRPSTTPCIVQLLSNAEFDSFNPVSFTYTPPADCPGPWAKVVFTADINVTAGVQYDRTANFWLGPTIIYFGTTAEPGSTLAPSWHVESDLTDYSPIFLTTQQGTADIGNLVNTTYTGIIYASSTLEFYPLAPGQTAPVTANEVLALSAGPTGGTVALNSSTDTLSGTFTFPTNIQNVYLDVFSQSQSDDEFWYTCVPNDVASKLESCTNTGFRETEITIDGAPAGVAPVYPWIFTGGIDPFLWFPIPGIQTLNMVPYRVDLTPFAAQLNDGQQHTVSLSVFNADNYFSATASLLLYLDSGSTTVTGALTENTLTVAPTPVVTENLNLSSTISGTVGVASNRNFTIAGYVNTSHGKVTTTISQQINFVNSQKFVINSLEYVQDINQISHHSRHHRPTHHHHHQQLPVPPDTQHRRGRRIQRRHRRDHHRLAKLRQQKHDGTERRPHLRQHAHQRRPSPGHAGLRLQRKLPEQHRSVRIPGLPKHRHHRPKRPLQTNRRRQRPNLLQPHLLPVKEQEKKKKQ
jgi:hypothetical protein